MSDGDDHGGVKLEGATANVSIDVLNKLVDVCERLTLIEDRLTDPDSDQNKPRPCCQVVQPKSKYEASFESFLAPSPLLKGSQVRSEDRELFEKYHVLKDSLKEVNIPGDLLLSEGWNAKDSNKRMLSLLRKSYSYLKTSLQLLKKLCDEGDISPAAQKLMFTSLAAHAKVLQSESTTCFLEGASSHKDPMGLYKALNNNTNLTSEEKDNFKLSAELFVVSKNAEAASTTTDKPVFTSTSFKGKGRGKGPNKDWWFNKKSGQKDKDHSKDPFEASVSTGASHKP